MREVIAGLLVALPFGVGAASGPTALDPVEWFRFADPAITESSGLVLADGLAVTTNDSGDSGRVFVVDTATGQTVRTVDWSEEPDDVEALAPGPDGSVWVADIGDNRRSRESVVVTRVPLDGGEPASYSLVYPEGALDAETLLSHPRTGQLFVVSKGVMGGTVYAAPRSLAPGDNALQEVAPAVGMATDGAFLPDGRHVLVRTYGAVVVYAFPSWEQVGVVDLPPQEQGEAIAVDPGSGAIAVSSEGIEAPVLRVELPAEVRRAMAAPSSTAVPTPSIPAPTSEPTPVHPADRAEGQTREAWPWVMGGLLFVVAVGVLVRALRPR